VSQPQPGKLDHRCPQPRIAGFGHALFARDGSALPGRRRQPGVIGAVNAPVGTVIFSGNEFQLPPISTLIKDGQIIMGLPASQIPLWTELPARFFLAFGEGDGFGNRPVIECLHDLSQTAKDVLFTLSSLRPGATFPTPT
jgi:hypothetical protein